MTYGLVILQSSMQHAAVQTLLCSVIPAVRLSVQQKRKQRCCDAMCDQACKPQTLQG